MELLHFLRHYRLPLLLTLLPLLAYLLWADRAMTVTRYTVPLPQLPESFEGLKIAHISDLHNDQLGRDNSKLLAALEREKPDLLFITGDLVDSRRTDFQVSLNFVERAIQIAPVYYVPGNHEQRLVKYPDFRDALGQAGVTVLENQRVSLWRDGARISIIGLPDPNFEYADAEHYLNLLADQDCVQLLLSHRPELLEVYGKAGVDVAFSGHAHGGQIRIPLVGGLIAPHQGWFPNITSGIHTSGETQLVVSRGLGRSKFPIRINNRPELVIVQLSR